MSLADHAIWWHVYPLGALGAPIRDTEEGVHHRLPRLINWLDHAVELGCSGVLLGPVFASTTHGYDTTDHYHVDPRLGDEADLDGFLAACHERGLSVMLDGVFNHVGVQHRWVGERSPMIAWDGDRPRAWEGNHDLAELDHHNPSVVEFVVEVMTHWLRRGVAGWRLDVAYAVPGWFWAQVVDRVRSEFPDALFLGEVIHGDYAQIARDGHLDSVTAYETWKGTWSALKDANAWELAHALERHQQFSAGHVLNTFLGNHDTDRLASLVAPEKLPLAIATVMTIPGMPSIYYGDELGLTGRRGHGFGADDDVRPTLPEQPGPGAYPEVFRLWQELIGLRRRHPWLSRAELRIEEKTNDTLHWSCHAGAERLDVRLALGDRPGVQITCSDGEVWERSA